MDLGFVVVGENGNRPRVLRPSVADENPASARVPRPVLPDPRQFHAPGGPMQVHALAPHLRRLLQQLGLLPLCEGFQRGDDLDATGDHEDGDLARPVKLADRPSEHPSPTAAAAGAVLTSRSVTTAPSRLTAAASPIFTRATASAPKTGTATLASADLLNHASEDLDGSGADHEGLSHTPFLRTLAKDRRVRTRHLRVNGQRQGEALLVLEGHEVEGHSIPEDRRGRALEGGPEHVPEEHHLPATRPPHFGVSLVFRRSSGSE